MTKNVLLLFVKNPVLGKVKTRLAATLGKEKALRIYLYLLEYTASLLRHSSDFDKVVFYSDYISNDDVFDDLHFQKQVQLQHPNLGERMAAAFVWAQAQGYQRVVIIGSDCLELEQHHLAAAFAALQQQRFVIGAAKDGGYYLLGMNEWHPALFQNKQWSTASVFRDTLADMLALGEAPFLLPALSDIDEEQDLPKELQGFL